MPSPGKVQKEAIVILIGIDIYNRRKQLKLATCLRQGVHCMWGKDYSKPLENIRIGSKNTGRWLTRDRNRSSHARNVFSHHDGKATITRADI
jgi:hypothetical protein